MWIYEDIIHIDHPSNFKLGIYRTLNFISFKVNSLDSCVKLQECTNLGTNWHHLVVSSPVTLHTKNCTFEKCRFLGETRSLTFKIH
jgi:hypothetical protein